MDFVCFKWTPPPIYRSKFDASTVNTLWSMIGRNYDGPARLHCVTDDPRGISKEVDVIPLWETFGNLKSPHGIAYPSCYRRLPAFGENARALFGERFAMLDLDVVVTGLLNPLVDIDDDFKIWGDTARGTPYNGSLVYMKAGARRQVFETFDPVTSPARGRALGYIGSDQAWIGACLGPNEKKWTARDGVYSFRNEIQFRNPMQPGTNGQLPPGARIVIFHGAVDPWHPNAALQYRWIREHYR